MDVKHAILNGDLNEKVYMDIPQGFKNSSNRNEVYKLRRSLYGLKQPPRAWFERFLTIVNDIRYTWGQTDHTIFFKHSLEGKNKDTYCTRDSISNI